MKVIRFYPGSGPHFGLPPPAAPCSSINPYSARAIHYKREQFPLLRNWARIINVERAIDTVLAADRGFETIKWFGRYYFGFESSGGNKFLALAPDNKCRKLAAIFTAEDAADAFVAEHASGDVELVAVNGETLQISEDHAARWYGLQLLRTNDSTRVCDRLRR